MKINKNTDYEKEAKTIAERETGGTADDADLEENEGTLIFEVDVDLPDDKEATVKINAYTGKVANIVYEDWRFLIKFSSFSRFPFMLSV